jgi:hypothetical protein
LPIRSHFFFSAPSGVRWPSEPRRAMFIAVIEEFAVAVAVAVSVAGAIGNGW